jgi:hypothetical protein
MMGSRWVKSGVAALQCGEATLAPGNERDAGALKGTASCVQRASSHHNVSPSVLLPQRLLFRLTPFVLSGLDAGHQFIPLFAYL